MLHSLKVCNITLILCDIPFKGPPHYFDIKPILGSLAGNHHVWDKSAFKEISEFFICGVSGKIC
jgi:hypothetical protein